MKIGAGDFSDEGAGSITPTAWSGASGRDATPEFAARGDRRDGAPRRTKGTKAEEARTPSFLSQRAYERTQTDRRRSRSRLCLVRGRFERARRERRSRRCRVAATRFSVQNERFCFESEDAETRARIVRRRRGDASRSTTRVAPNAASSRRRRRRRRSPPPTNADSSAEISTRRSPGGRLYASVVPPSSSVSSISSVFLLARLFRARFELRSVATSASTASSVASKSPATRLAFNARTAAACAATAASAAAASYAPPFLPPRAIKPRPPRATRSPPRRPPRPRRLPSSRAPPRPVAVAFARVDFPSSLISSSSSRARTTCMIMWFGPIIFPRLPRGAVPGARGTRRKMAPAFGRSFCATPSLDLNATRNATLCPCSRKRSVWTALVFRSLALIRAESRVLSLGRVGGVPPRAYAVRSF